MRNVHSYKTEGIILGRKNVGEADRILTVFTKYHGKIRVIAKGIRRPKSRKRGTLELFNQAVLFLAKGKTFDIVTEAQVKNDFRKWRSDLLRIGIAYHFAEVTEKLTREGEELRRVYEFLLQAFSELDSVQYWRLHEFITDYKRHLLRELGFLAEGKERQDLDSYIEQLTQSRLKTKRFLKVLE